MSEIQQQEQALLDLPAILTIREVSRFRNEWQMLVRKHKALLIDASEVQEIDTAGFQLLLSYLKECDVNASDISFDPPASEVFLSTAGLLGMNLSLGIE